MKALLLAAGLGTRLRPLTEVLPKPLCLFYGRPILDLVYEQIKKVGIHQIAINTHHLPLVINQHIQKHPAVYTPPPHISHEPEILGTGGAINPLRAWLGSDDLLICNGDVMADIDLKALVQQHRESGSDATMVLLDRHKKGTNPVAYEGTAIRAIGDQPVKATERHTLATFSGIHIIGPRLVRAIPAGGSPSIIEAYHRLLAEGARIQAFIHRGFWEDLGTPRDYFAAHQAVLLHPDRAGLCQRLGLDPSIRFEGDSALCGPGPFPERRQNSFLFGPIQGDQGEQPIQSCLVYPSTVIKPGQKLENGIITPEVCMGIV
ncbi:nucleotidyltransferase family protein [Oligoflexus tunisiensis]|uniref:nucleotidyltransferase family protein n=1 Tax=Oligoflexus tunisiensis TaxID=708132 RepID=UPI00114D05F2|nr:sugar phosphate nucleotidyltransferase [Oligoflexus tunisiensis]